MPELPTVGGDSGTWGQKLNDFLTVAHAADGKLVDARFPASAEKAALAGTHGTPGGSNRYVTNSDPRLSGGGGAGFSARDYLRLDDPIVGQWAGSNDGGITYYPSESVDASPDQTAKFQAALNNAGRNGVPNTILIAGLFACDGTVTYPSDKQIVLIGTGSGTHLNHSSAGIYFRTDVGGDPESSTAQYAINVSKNFGVVMENFSLRGPAGVGILYGQFPSNLSGMLLPGECFLRKLRVHGFGAGIALTNDHHFLSECNLQSNGYNLHFPDNPDGGLGDETVLKCQLTNATRASIALCDTGTIAALKLGDNGHAGMGPYGIYRYANKIGVTVSAAGSAASPTVTNVAFSTRVPSAGTRVEGPNIVFDSYITNVSGPAGNYSLTLSENPTGAVTSITIFKSPRDTAAASLMQELWSWEGLGNAQFYDEPNHQYNSPGSWAGISNDGGDLSSFPAHELRWQQYVTCAGSSGSSTLTNVALSHWRPIKGDSVSNAWTDPTETGTPIQLDTYVTGVKGTPGNWTLTLSKPLVGTATNVMIGKPNRNAGFDVGHASGFHWRENSMPYVYATQPDRLFQPFTIRARTISNIVADHHTNSQLVSYPKTRPFLASVPDGTPLGTLPSAGTTAVNGISLGVGDPRTGKTLGTAWPVTESVSEGELAELYSYGEVRRWRGGAGSLYVGVFQVDLTAGEIAPIIYAGSSAYIKCKNTSGSNIGAGLLVKPHSDGGIQVASVGDAGIIGRTRDAAIADGALGPVVLF